MDKIVTCQEQLQAPLCVTEYHNVINHSDLGMSLNCILTYVNLNSSSKLLQYSLAEELLSFF